MINWRPYLSPLLPAFLFVMVLAIMFVGSHILTVNTAFEVLSQAPLGQSIGPSNAKVTIVEFMDYRCIPCRHINPMIKKVAEKHPDIRVVFRNMPIGIPSILENRVALAAGMQGKFMQVHDMLMQREAPLKEEELEDISHKEGLDYMALRRDLRGRTVTENLDRTFDYARILGIKADPTFLVGKDIYTTAYGMPTMDDFDEMIAKAKGEAVDDDEDKPHPRRRLRRGRAHPPLEAQDQKG